MPTTGGSDAHLAEEVGVYATRFSKIIHDEEELISALKANDAVPGTLQKTVEKGEEYKMAKEKGKWEKLVRRMEILLRLRSFPVAMKMLEKKAQLQEVPFLRRPENKVSMCQLINLVRNFDWDRGCRRGGFYAPHVFFHFGT